MIRPLDVTTSVLTTIGRLASGARVGTLGKRPARPLELYEFEACPFCRKVREALSILDLEAIVYPCPKGGPTWRPRIREQGGRELFPYLVDPNTGRAMYESSDIVAYLFSEYGDGRVPAALGAGVLTDVSSMLSGLWRLGGGSRYRRARVPDSCSSSTRSRRRRSAGSRARRSRASSSPTGCTTWRRAVRGARSSARARGA